MTPFDIVVCVSAVCMSGGSIAYSLYVVRSNRFERPTEAQVQHMIDTAPRGRFDTVLTRINSTKEH